MKIFFFLLLLLSATLNAQPINEALTEYLQQRIYWCNDQMNDLSFDLSSNHAGYIFGQKMAYTDILYKIHHHPTRVADILPEHAIVLTENTAAATR
jgi:hypothetical protein